MEIVALLASATIVALVALVALVAWPWRVEATLKATTSASAISLAAGLDVARLSASAAAILGGPGVVAIHLRARELWRRPIAQVTVEAFLHGLQELLARPTTKKSALRRAADRAQAWLIARTDVSDLPGLGVRVLLGLRDVSFHGAITCGFSDPALTGKTAAWLFPIAGVLAPVGALDVSFDWTGRNRLDGAASVSFRVVPARVALEGLRFAWHHLHLRSAPALVSPTMSASITTR